MTASDTTELCASRAGGMGAAYEAMEDRISRRVAIKVLHADVSAERDSRLRFINEARVCQSGPSSQFDNGP